MPRMAWWGTLLVAAALAAQGAREVEALDLDREGVALLQVAGTAPADGVTDLDDQIKTQQKTDGTHDSAHGGASDSGAATASDHSHAMYPTDDAGGYGKAGATGGGGYGSGLTTPEQNTALF